MESLTPSPDPVDLRSHLAAAEDARDRLVRQLPPPHREHVLLGLAVAVQVAAAAAGIAAQSTRGVLLAVAGCIPFVVVVVALRRRFGRRTGATVDGWVSRALLGTSAASSVSYAGGLTGAVWAAMAGHPLAAGLLSAATGGAYALSAHLWWRAYRRDPAGAARGESRWMLLAIGAVAVTGLVVLAVAGR